MKKTPPKTSQNIIRSSTAEYLTFVASTGGDESIEVRYEDENIWMTQRMMAELYGVTVSTVNQHLKKLFEDSEMDDSVIKQYLIVQAEIKKQTYTSGSPPPPSLTSSPTPP